jgi:ATP-dependent Lon protease
MFENLFFGAPPTDDADFTPMISINEDEAESNEAVPDTLPALALKNTVLFPGIVIPITVGRDKSIKAVQKAHAGDKLIAVFAQKDISQEDPGFDDIYKVGCMAKVIKLLRMPDGTVTAILQGTHRIKWKVALSEDPYLEAKVEQIHYQPVREELEFEASISTIRDLAKKIIDLSPQIPTEANVMLNNISNNVFLLNFISSNMNAEVGLKQEILEISDLTEKARRVLKQMNKDLQMLEIKDQIDHKVREDIEKQQRDYYLNQQLKTIQEELGQNPVEMEVGQLEKRAKKKKWSKAVQQHFEKELKKVRRINPQVAEYSVMLNYLELMLDLPWEETTDDQFDLSEVKKVLDKDHYGLEQVKERILEHLAVLKLKGDMKAPIVCLVGPPGVGKTSLGRSIADALGRKFTRMSLGGLHDESEIRGHRKTYIGAMPGRILQALKKAGSSNPVFILDEIDKLGKDFRGDPSSALLEVLDPEQNSTFYDNYLELEYDLSRVLFIATANSLASIQPALLDRMEIIEVSGYATEEKVQIARRHLVPKQRKEHGLKSTDIKISEKMLSFIAEHYTRESGVRSLDRKIAGIMRGIARKVAMDEKYRKSINEEDIREMLGPEKVRPDLYVEAQVPGVAVGLAWTRVGGDILFIETSTNPGKGKLTLTGNLGDVMKESATTALSFIKAHHKKLGIDPSVFVDLDIHIHIPEGAIPKDGPSAGITMMTSIASALRKKPVKPFLAMTGEITLRGKVLPVGGIKEKILAAQRSGMKEVMLCADNQKHVEEIKKDYIKGLKFVYVNRMEEVLDYSLGIWDF